MINNVGFSQNPLASRIKYQKPAFCAGKSVELSLPNLVELALFDLKLAGETIKKDTLSIGAKETPEGGHIFTAVFPELNNKDLGRTDIVGIQYIIETTPIHEIAKNGIQLPIFTESGKELLEKPLPFPLSTFSRCKTRMDYFLKNNFPRMSLEETTNFLTEICKFVTGRQ